MAAEMASPVHHRQLPPFNIRPNHHGVIFERRVSVILPEGERPDGFTLVAWGDFDGRGIWTFEQDEEWVNVTYDWKIKAEKPLLRYFSFIMKPLFSANHHWAMAKGEESLKLELARRHVANQEELALIPTPPKPTPGSPVPLLLFTTTIFASLVGLSYMVVRLLNRD